MEHDAIQATAFRLERYFDWYLRVDPDATPAMLSIVSRFVRAATASRSQAEATALLRESAGFALGSPWEEMRSTLQQLAQTC